MTTWRLFNTGADDGDDWFLDSFEVPTVDDALDAWARDKGHESWTDYLTSNPVSNLEGELVLVDEHGNHVYRCGAAS